MHHPGSRIRLAGKEPSMHPDEQRQKVRPKPQKGQGLQPPLFPRAAATDEESLALTIVLGPNLYSYGAGGGKASGYAMRCPLHSSPGAARPRAPFKWSANLFG